MKNLMTSLKKQLLEAAPGKVDEEVLHRIPQT
jgi:hypothetical protein